MGKTASVDSGCAPAGKGCSRHLDLGKFLHLRTGQQGGIWSWSLGASPEVNIKGNTPPTSNRPREAAEEGLAPGFHLEPLGPLLRQVRAHPSPSRDPRDSSRPGILLFGTKQTNERHLFGISCPFSAAAGEKPHCCQLSSEHHRGAAGEPTRSLGKRAGGGSLLPSRGRPVLPGGRWHACAHPWTTVGYLLPSVLRQTLSW